MSCTLSVAMSRILTKDNLEQHQRALANTSKVKSHGPYGPPRLLAG